MDMKVDGEACRSMGLAAGDWEIDGMATWEKGGQSGPSTASARCRLGMVQQAAKAWNRRVHKKRAEQE